MADVSGKLVEEAGQVVLGIIAVARLGLDQGQLAIEDAALSPALFSAQMRPWCAATISRLIANPSPVPPLPDFVLLDWTNLSNTSSDSSAGIPGPSSRMLTRRDLDMRRHADVTVPAAART